MRPGPGQLERSLVALTIGVHQGRVMRERLLADTRTGEYEQQIQLPLSGSAGNQAAFADQDVYFEFPFLYAPAQRTVPFDRPHFSHGVEILDAGADLVQLGAHVIAWKVNSSGWYIGATVRLHCLAPNVTTTPVAFNAIAHLTFQGYATYAEGNEYQQ